jgi:hypothetical protein
VDGRRATAETVTSVCPVLASSLPPRLAHDAWPVFCPFGSRLRAATHSRSLHATRPRPEAPRTTGAPSPGSAHGLAAPAEKGVRKGGCARPPGAPENVQSRWLRAHALPENSVIHSGCARECGWGMGGHSLGWTGARGPRVVPASRGRAPDPLFRKSIINVGSPRPTRACPAAAAAACVRHAGYMQDVAPQQPQPPPTPPDATQEKETAILRDAVSTISSFAFPGVRRHRGAQAEHHPYTPSSTRVASGSL